MMYGREKSDSAIVAVKPTNKAVATAAEPVEPRAGAKGNARQQSTHRTQGERVAQALERVRQAARQRKKERFTAVPAENSDPAILMMQSAKNRNSGNPAADLNRTREWRILVQRQVSSRFDVIASVRFQNLTQMASPRTMMWSTHSRRIDPISRSAKPFCQGEAGAVGLSRMPMARNRRVTTLP